MKKGLVWNNDIDDIVVATFMIILLLFFFFLPTISVNDLLEDMVENT